MKGHRIARECEEWWKKHGGDHESAAWHAYNKDELELFVTKADEITSEHSNYGRFGMSKAGGCTRAAGLKWLGYEGEPFSGSTNVTFHIGHLLECVGIATLRAVGYQVDGTQGQVTIDPFMQSASDGIIYLGGYEVDCNDVRVPEPTVLSVKTAGYKMSARNKRQGFAALPFDGVKYGQRSWWAQAQAEMHGHGIQNTLVFVVAKDIVKAYESDEYLGERGNGSLTFYAELLDYDKEWCEEHLLPTWQTQWDSVQEGKAGSPMYFTGTKFERLAEMASPGSATSIWGGPNQKITGTFNPCGGCDMLKACREARVKEFKP